MRKEIQRDKWLPYPAKYGGEMYISPKGDNVVCFHSKIQYNTKYSDPTLQFWQCIDCGDSSMKPHEYVYSFTSYTPDFFAPVEKLYGKQTTIC